MSNYIIIICNVCSYNICVNDGTNCQVSIKSLVMFHGFSFVLHYVSHFSLILCQKEKIRNNKKDDLKKKILEKIER